MPHVDYFSPSTVIYAFLTPEADLLQLWPLSVHGQR